MSRDSSEIRLEHRTRRFPASLAGFFQDSLPFREAPAQHLPTGCQGLRDSLGQDSFGGAALKKERKQEKKEKKEENSMNGKGVPTDGAVTRRCRSS